MAKNITIIEPRYSTTDAEALFKGQWLTRELARREGFSFLDRQDVEYRTPDGKLVAKLVTNIFDSQTQARRHQLWSKVKGAPRNRPEIFGPGARQKLLRKDGKLTNYVGVPDSVTKAVGGQTDMLGLYSYTGRKKGKCAPTAWTVRRPELFYQALKEATVLTQIFEKMLPVEAGVQRAEIKKIMPGWYMPGTLFTSVYGIKNHPTAVHTDTFDIPQATGVLTTSGNFRGNEFCLPEFGLVLDLQPSDVLFVDVHKLHGNLPRTAGERVAQVYFVRKGMHLCGREASAVEIPFAVPPKEKTILRPKRTTLKEAA